MLINEKEMMKNDNVDHPISKKIANIPKYKKLFLDESDRGCALLAVSLLEYELEKLLSKKCLSDKKIQKKLFESRGAFSTLSSKIDVAYAFGLTPKKHYQNMHKVREIRNLFGHSYKKISFSTIDISQKIRAIRLEHHTKKHKSRTIFIDIISQILIDIYIQTEIIDEAIEPEYFSVNPNHYF